AHNQLFKHMRREVLRRIGDETSSGTKSSLDELIVQAWRTNASPRDPHRILANLPCPLYVTTNLSRVLEAALKDANVEARSAVCHWNDYYDRSPSPGELSPEKPLVYHPFGRLDIPESVVVTEDEYFDYLIATAMSDDDVDKAVRATLNRSALMFLGFQLTEWNLRVLFRSIMRSGGQSGRKRFTHVAVQVDPNQPGIAEPDRVYAYLQRFFEKQFSITIFRGTAAEFIDTLVERWQETYGEDLTAQRAKWSREG
ncbi:MAG: SIR2 family NAD-dependent protein deacylase, partial [Thermoanaerobaculia bacterium]